MAGRITILITGSNTGLGFESVKALYKSSTAYDILMGCRSLEKGEAAIESLKKDIPQSSSTVSAVQVDVESDDTIKKAFDTITSKHGKLDILINNAGANFDKEMQDGKYGLREGWIKAWNTNVAGTNVMTVTFIPLLLKSQNPRLIYITSGTSSMAETERVDNKVFEAINGSPDAGWPKEKMLNPITSYRSSKAGLNMMMREWHRILKNDGVKVCALSPGFLATNLNGLRREQLLKMGALEPSQGGNFVKSVVEGARDKDMGKVIRVDMVQPW